MFADQGGYKLRLEWGSAGLENLALTEATVIVDVLSFSTSVDVAVSRGAVIFPYAWKDDRAERFAREQGASVAKARAEQGFSLSPASLLTIASGTRLVLPSPNGSSLSTLALRSPYVLTACLRNASAVGRYCQRFETVALIPAGERWRDGSLRPAFEDYLGAGAVIETIGSANMSPEADAAKQLFLAYKHRLEIALLTCSSGLELRERGFVQDIMLAAEYDSSVSIPLLNKGAYSQAL